MQVTLANMKRCWRVAHHSVHAFAYRVSPLRKLSYSSATCTYAGHQRASSSNAKEGLKRSIGLGLVHTGDPYGSHGRASTRGLNRRTLLVRTLPTRNYIYMYEDRCSRRSKLRKARNARNARNAGNVRNAGNSRNARNTRNARNATNARNVRNSRNVRNDRSARNARNS